MRIVLIFSVYVAMLQVSAAQNFCGHIKYRYTYYNTNDKKEITTTVDDFKTEDFYICKNRFKVLFDGDLKDIYIGDSLTFFQVGPDSTIRYIRADSAYGQLDPVFTNPRKNVVYKGKQYNTIESNDDFERTTYYFNDEVIVDPTLFRHLELYHWNTFFKNTNGSLRLIIINVNKDITAIGEAVEINSISMPDDDFAPPKGYKIMPYTSFEILN